MAPTEKDVSSQNQETSTSALPSWLQSKRIKLFFIAVYAVLAFLSFFIFIPIIITKNNSDGYCLLYADSESSGEGSVCNYVIAVGVIIFVIYTLRAVLLAMELFSASFSSKLPMTFLNSLVMGCIVLVLDMMILLLLLVAASIISAGFSHMCDELFGDRDRCELSGSVRILGTGTINHSFYKQLSIAEGSTWFTFCFWVIVVVLKVGIFWKTGSFKKGFSAGAQTNSPI